MPRRDTQALAALVVAAAGLRFATIDVQSFWFDEALTARMLELPLHETVGELPDRQLTPPLYYVLAWPWAQVLGTSEVALRSLSALFGIATVPLAYLAGRALASPRAGLAVAALCAFNPLLVWYSQEARPYSLLVLLGTASVWLWARTLRDGGGRAVALWALVAALALLTHYYAAFLVVPQGLWLLRAQRRHARALAPALAALAAVGAVGAALIPLAVHQNERIGTAYISGGSLARRALGVPEDFLTGFAIGFNLPIETVLAVVAGAAALFGLVLAAVRTTPPERRGAALAAGLAAVAVGVPVVFAAAGIDYVNTRNMLIAWPPAMLAVGIGLGAARAGLVGVVALCAVGVTTTVVVARDATYQREDWRKSAEALGPAPAPRVVVVPPLSGDVALPLYRHGLAPLPAGGAPVREVAVVTPRNSRLQGDDGARPASPAPPSPAFALVERRYDEDITLLRFRADRPVRVTPAAAARAAEGVIPAASPLLERPGAAGSGPPPLP